MKRRIHNRTRQKNKLKNKILIVAATATFIVTMTTGILVYLNFQNVSKTRASGNGTEGAGGNMANGDIITEFTWEKDPVTAATLGPDAIKTSKEAHSMNGGRSSTNGIAPGKTGKSIDLEIAGTELFNQDGIDICIDYRYSEKNGSFFTRNGFNFGIENGFITIQYQVENKQGKIEKVKENTSYEVPSDPLFRTYRFMYNPNSGKAEMFVNSIIIWNRQHEMNTPLSWKNCGNIVIGKDMNGDGADRVIFDNLVVRTCGSVSPLAESLLNFMLEPKKEGVVIHWSTSMNEKVNYFTIERSINGVDFVNIGSVPVDPAKGEEEYIYTDRTETSASVVYYRLRQTFHNGKFVTHGLSAIKFKTDKSLSIERMSPTPFKSSFDISYFLPKSGRVWIQLCDEGGKVVNTVSFDAPQGKNVHVYRDEKNLIKGNYTVNLIFDSKKVSSRIEKI
jgi:hypothetical protein